MVKVFKTEELNRNKGENVLYSEIYEVKFWINTGNAWEQKTELYRTASKGRNDQVQKRWEKDYSNSNVDLISIKYQ